MIKQFKEAVALEPDGIAIYGFPGDEAMRPIIKEAREKGKEKNREEQVVESAKVKTKSAPRVPSAAEVEAHMASGHVNYRDWCERVQGQAVSDRQKQSKEEIWWYANLE